MKSILIAGGSGLIGLHLSRLLRQNGYAVSHLSRKADSLAEFPTYAWQPQTGYLDKRAFENTDALINLAGAGIADERWSAARKRLIIESRTKSNALIANSLVRLPHQIKTYIAASAIGYYGDSGADWVDETSDSGTGFLSESTVAWEKAIEQVAQPNMRKVVLRIGVVLDTEGGALAKMLLPFYARMATHFGNGQQYVSWIHRDDLCHIFKWALETPSVSGLFNAVSPQPVTNLAMTQAIAATKGGGYLSVPTPSFALRLALGEMADVVLNSTRVSAEKIVQAGFSFQFPHIGMALKDLLAQ
jgi:hypothetical protein